MMPSAPGITFFSIKWNGEQLQYIDKADLHAFAYWHIVGSPAHMRKWFIVAINLLLGAFVILIWALERKQGTENYDEVMSLDVPKILLSFTVLTFLILIMTMIKNRNRK
jgi:hypothetical protein